MRTTLSLIVSLAAGLMAASAPALAAGEAKTPPNIDFSFEGPFGSYDRAAVQRGFQVHRQVCASCHSLDLFAFRNLTGIGYSEDMAKAIAEEFTVTDGPNDQGEMFERPAALSDHMPAPFPNEETARMANGGAYPPDLSVIAKARGGGPDYLHALLTGYRQPPQGEELRPGLYWNDYFPGNRLAMPQPLYEGMVDYQDGTEASVEQMARDVTHFMMWIAEPHMEARKEMGFSFMLFMAVFTVLLYLTMKRVWKPVKEGRNVMEDDAA